MIWFILIIHHLKIEYLMHFMVMSPTPFSTKPNGQSQLLWRLRHEPLEMFAQVCPSWSQKGAVIHSVLGVGQGPLQPMDEVDWSEDDDVDEGDRPDEWRSPPLPSAGKGRASRPLWGITCRPVPMLPRGISSCWPSTLLFLFFFLIKGRLMQEPRAQRTLTTFLSSRAVHRECRASCSPRPSPTYRRPVLADPTSTSIFSRFPQFLTWLHFQQ